jgi:hypothetical protein
MDPPPTTAEDDERSDLSDYLGDIPEKSVDKLCKKGQVAKGEATCPKLDCAEAA